MAVAEVGQLDSDEGAHRAGSAYAVLTADSFDAAAELRDALAAVAGLSDEEWRDSWFEGRGRLMAIRIYPR